jgi:succinate dehydrogenase/fumarate reductase flavoprotein subunit
MRSHTVAAEGGAAGVIKDNDSLDNHFHDTVSGGDWLCDQDAVELFVNTAPLELLQLEHWGCPWSREPNGKVAVRHVAAEHCIAVVLVNRRVDDLSTREPAVVKRDPRAGEEDKRHGRQRDDA